MRGFGGRLFTEIDEGGAAVGHADEHETAAADVSGGRMRDSQREADGHSGVHGVAAGFQHSDADVGGERFLSNNHAFARVNWLAALGRLADKEKRKQEKRNESRSLTFLWRRHCVCLLTKRPRRQVVRATGQAAIDGALRSAAGPERSWLRAMI